jgi:hypothetical protein
MSDEVNDKLNQWTEEYYKYRRENPNSPLPTIHEPREIPQKDQVIQQKEVSEKPKKKARIVKINELFSEFFERKEEISDLRTIHWNRSREYPPEIQEEIERLQEENQSVLELIEAQGYRYLPENWDEGRYFGQFVLAEEYQETKEKYLRRKNL